jgi:hypothetical protein
VFLSIRLRIRATGSAIRLPAHSTISTPDARQVCELLFRMLECVRHRDIESHMDVYWNSPELLVVVDCEEYNGWQQLHDS